LAQRDQVEIDSGEPFDWRESPEKVQSRIELRRAAAPDDEKTWPELFEWFVTRLELVHRVFGPRVKALKLAEATEDEAAAV